MTVSFDRDDPRDIVERLRELRKRKRLSDRDSATISKAVGVILGLRETVRERTDQLLALMATRGGGR